MKKRASTPAQAIGKLREAEVPLSQRHKVGEVTRSWGSLSKLAIDERVSAEGCS